MKSDIEKINKTSKKNNNNPNKKNKSQNIDVKNDSIPKKKIEVQKEPLTKKVVVKNGVNDKLIEEKKINKIVTNEQKENTVKKSKNKKKKNSQDINVKNDSIPKKKIEVQKISSTNEIFDKKQEDNNLKEEKKLVEKKDDVTKKKIGFQKEFSTKKIIDEKEKLEKTIDVVQETIFQSEEDIFFEQQSDKDKDLVLKKGTKVKEDDILKLAHDILKSNENIKNNINNNGKKNNFSGKRKKKILKYIILLINLFCVVVFLEFLCDKENNVNKIEKIKEEPKVSLEEIKTYYSDFVKLMNGSSLYIKEGDSYAKVSNIVGEIEVSLDQNYEIVDEYFKVLNSDYYVKYNSVSQIERLTSVNNEYRYYKNYIPYNENIRLNENSKLFVDDINYYEISDGSYPIIIKDTDRYGIEFNNRLVYVNKSDVLEVVSSENTTELITDGISVLNYHFVVSAEEMKSCAQTICIREDKFDSQIKYLKDNNYYGVSMRDLELFIDGKIQLPKNSVSITIDDGWYVQRAIWILEKYQILGTLFLIGDLASPNDYLSGYLEVHSHGWSIHGGNDCPGTGWRGGLHCFDRDRVLEDLRKSRESLDNTTYFCYPFYEVSARGIDLLKEAGFTMAFAGQKTDSKARVGQDKFRIPRYVIYGSTSMNTFINYVD